MCGIVVVSLFLIDIWLLFGGPQKEPATVDPYERLHDFLILVYIIGERQEFKPFDQK